MIWLRFAPRWRLSTCFALVATASALAGGRQLWTAKLPGEVKWHALTELGSLLVGTPDAIACFDSDSGQQLWSRPEFKKSSPFNAREIPGTPYLICHSAEGIAGHKITLHQVDYLTGRTVWQTPTLTGQFLGVLPVPAKGLVLFLVNGAGPDGKDQGTYLHAHDMADGKQRWATKLAKLGAIQLHIADKAGKFMPAMDLSGYHDPVVDGDNIYLPYLGCHCVDLNTGAIKWGAEFPAGDKGFKKTYAPLRIAGDRIYGAGGGSVIAIDRQTGAIVWKSERISAYAGLLKARHNALVSQIELVGDKVFARYGGNFSNGQTVMLREPLGVVALNAADGKDVYHFADAKDGLTNIAVLPQSNMLLVADGHHLHGIDVAGPVPAKAFQVPIEFKRKMGGGDIAQLGLGALGGLRGIAKAATSQNKSRLDVPVAIAQRGERIVVQGKQHLLCFDPAGRQIAWSTYCAAPSDTLGMTALFAVTAASAVYGNALGMQGGVGSSAFNSGVDVTHSALNVYHQHAGKRKSATQSAGSYSFMLTKVEDGSDKGVGLLGINLANGEGEKKFVLGTSEPEYRVDEALGRLFFFKGRDAIVAYEL